MSIRGDQLVEGDDPALNLAPDSSGHTDFNLPISGSQDPNNRKIPRSAEVTSSALATARPRRALTGAPKQRTCSLLDNAKRHPHREFEDLEVHGSE